METSQQNFDLCGVQSTENFDLYGDHSTENFDLGGVQSTENFDFCDYQSRMTINCSVSSLKGGKNGHALLPCIPQLVMPL